MPCIAFGAALPRRCECISASPAIWVWLAATAPLPALRHSDRMVIRMPIENAISRMRSWRGSDRWPISGRRRASSPPPPPACWPAFLAAARCLRRVRLPSRRAASSAEPVDAPPDAPMAAGGSITATAVAVAAAGIMPAPNWVSGDASTVLPSSLSLGRKFIESFEANPIPAPVQNLSLL